MKFESAYKQLQPGERQFVDGFIIALDVENARRLERLDVTLARWSATFDLDAVEQRARDMFAKPMVQAAISERVREIAADRDLTPQRIVQEHVKLAFSNMRDYVSVGEDGTAQPDLTDLTPEQWAAIQQIDFEEEYSRGKTTRRMKLKLYSKQASLAELAKWNGLDKPDSQLAVAYRSMPQELTRLSENLSVRDVADKYAEFIAND